MSRADFVTVNRADLERLLDTFAAHCPVDAPVDYLREWVRCWQDTYRVTLRDDAGSQARESGQVRSTIGDSA